MNKAENCQKHIGEPDNHDNSLGDNLPNENILPKNFNCPKLLHYFQVADVEQISLIPGDKLFIEYKKKPWGNSEVRISRTVERANNQIIPVPALQEFIDYCQKTNKSSLNQDELNRLSPQTSQPTHLRENNHPA